MTFANCHQALMGSWSRLGERFRVRPACPGFRAGGTRAEPRGAPGFAAATVLLGSKKRHNSGGRESEHWEPWF